jgi:tRNA U34 5-carboxymethylaminomethyl modifying enzyme MnmG/GidA
MTKIQSTSSKNQKQKLKKNLKQSEEIETIKNELYYLHGVSKPLDVEVAKQMMASVPIYESNPKIANRWE